MMGLNTLLNNLNTRLTPVFFVQLLSLQLLAMNTVGQRVEFTSSNLPIVVIDTWGQEIVDDPRIVVHMGIIDNGPGLRNNLTDNFNDYDGLIAIELRGSSSSWYPKKQYRFETQDSLGENLNVSIMGLPEENDWIFYGPYDDQSLIRNVFAFQLSNDMGRYASRTRFCEIVLNNDYRGLYVLMEKIKRDNNRIDISAMDENDISGDAVTGGYIIKIDKFEGENIGYWVTSNAVTYQYHYPKADEIVTPQELYIQDFIARFENAMNGPSPPDPSTGYPAYLDVSSFVDHFLINELAKNVDAYRISAYLYKERDSNGGKLYAGPIWDFNLSFGKAWYFVDLFLTEGWQVHYNTWRPWDGGVPFWWEIISSDNFFVGQLINRWQQLRNGIFNEDSLYYRIDVLVDTIAEAHIRNFERWPGSVSDHSYEEEITQLKDWIGDRLDWIDGNLSLLTIYDPYTQREFIAEYFSISQNYPNPFNASTTIRYNLPNRSDVRIIIYDLNGNKVTTLVSEIQEAGYKSATWDGTSDQHQPISSGAYFYKVHAGEFIQTRKMILLK